MKIRLDTLVQRQTGLARAAAQALIRAGSVYTAQGHVLDKPGLRLDENTRLDVREQPRFVSRGGEKLAAALDAFHVDVTGRIAIDVGASTGGFTDCLLQRGAARVYAVDVGYGQLAWKLRNDPRVVVRERTNIRRLELRMLPETPDFFTVDCSFISLRIVLPPLKALVSAHAQGVVLIKPQFEAGRGQVGKRGVVRDPLVHEQAVEAVLTSAEKLGFRRVGVIPSPLRGPAGNVEFLALLSL